MFTPTFLFALPAFSAVALAQSGALWRCSLAPFINTAIYPGGGRLKGGNTPAQGTALGKPPNHTIRAL